MLQEITYPTNRYQPRSRPQYGRLCQKCFIRIFRSPAQAALGGVVFEAGENLDVDGLCPKCAGYQFVEITIQQEIETMLSTNGHFEFGEVETNVAPPPDLRPRAGQSKYNAVTQVVCDSAPGQWHRVQVPTKSDGQRLNGHLRKYGQTHGRDITGSVRELDGVVWLYWNWKPAAEEVEAEPVEPEAAAVG